VKISSGEVQIMCAPLYADLASDKALYVNLLGLFVQFTSAP
jgi:hypothetical protein